MLKLWTHMPLLGLPHIPVDPQYGQEMMYERQGPIGLMQTPVSSRHLVNMDPMVDPHTRGIRIHPNQTEAELTNPGDLRDLFPVSDLSKHLPLKRDNVYIIGDENWNARVLSHEGRHGGLPNRTDEELLNRLFDVFRGLGTEDLPSASWDYVTERFYGYEDKDGWEERAIQLTETYGKKLGAIKLAYEDMEKHKDKLIELETKAYVEDIMGEDEEAKLKDGPIWRNTKKLITKQYNDRLRRFRDRLGEYMKEWREGTIDE